VPTSGLSVSLSKTTGNFAEGTRVAESEVFGWSRIPTNNRSRIFFPTPEVHFNYFLHRTPKLGILTRVCWNGTVSFETLLKQRILAVNRDFHWFLFATKLLTAKLHPCYVKESVLQVLEGVSGRILRTRSRTFTSDSTNPGSNCLAVRCAFETYRVVAWTMCKKLRSCVLYLFEPLLRG